MGILVYNSKDSGGVGSTNNLWEHSRGFSFRASRMEWDSLDNRSFSLVEDPFWTSDSSTVKQISIVLSLICGNLYDSNKKLM